MKLKRRGGKGLLKGGEGKGEGKKFGEKGRAERASVS